MGESSFTSPNNFLDGLKESTRSLISRRNELQMECTRLASELGDLNERFAICQQKLESYELEDGYKPSEQILLRSILRHGFRELPWLFQESHHSVECVPNIEPVRSIKSRRLVKTLGSVSSLDQNDRHSFAVSYAMCHYSSRSVCTFIPKNACTNLRYSIALANGAIGGMSDFHWIHANNQSFNPGSLTELLQAEYTFVFLRNPFTRIASYFLDKLVGNSSSPADGSYEMAKALFPLPEEELTFRGFVDLLWREPAKIVQDVHIRPQLDFLVFDDYDDWFCLERYSDAVQRISDKIGLKIHDTRSLSTHTTYRLAVAVEESLPDRPIPYLRDLKQAGLTPCLKALYDHDIAFKVSALYLADVMMYVRKFGLATGVGYWLDLCRQDVCG